MANLFTEAGYEIVDFDEFADVYVVNTCTVTNMSDRKSRQILRRAKEINQNSILCVVGCYVQVSKEELKNFDEIDILLGTNDRKSIVNVVKEFEEKHSISNTENKDNVTQSNNIKVDVVTDIMKKQEYLEWGGTAYTSHERAEIKIQDGCDRFCTYCIIPYARGPVRSRNINDILMEVKKLVEKGIKEVVLTGIHIASYGKDLKNGEGLIDVIEKVNEVEGLSRIRLGSLEPIIIDKSFMDRITKLNKVCPHFHLSLQSGCDTTLQRMNRRYTTKQFREIVELIRSYLPDVALTTDIIVGFPGETKEEFEITYNFLKEINFSKMHVFKYSPRNGTKAALFPNQIDGSTKTKRSEILINLSNENEEKFAQKYVGKEVEVLFENEKEGHTSNYIKVIDNEKKQKVGDLKMVKIKLEKSGELYI